jgi:hypothetical protein
MHTTVESRQWAAGSTNNVGFDDDSKQEVIVIRSEVKQRHEVQLTFEMV